MTHNIASVAEANRCAGCGACITVCPQNAIQLLENRAGFYEARVNPEACRPCGRCRAVCPQVSPKGGISLLESRLYALQSAEPGTVQNCSSGGIAHELAAQALIQGAQVLGVIYDRAANRARHIVISNPAQLPLLDGSKYLQSNPAEAFQSALQEAKEHPEHRFLVFGTPCQITGLAAAAETLGIREQFLLAELFCHGVPSYLLWDETVKKAQRKLNTDQFDNVQFRYKKDDWHSYCLRIDAGGKTFFGRRETELFWQVFFENILLNDACYACTARKDRSCADLRLGDYWGTRFQSRSDGVSAVFAMTPRGGSAIQALLASGRVNQFVSGTPEEMLLAQNMAGYHQQELHNHAMQALRRGEKISTVVRSYRKKLTAKQKLKHFLLTASIILPDGLRAKLKKQTSGRSLKRMVDHA